MARITTGLFSGPAGWLEYLLDEWAPSEPQSAPPRGARFAAVVAHPHPQFGGTMHSRTVFYIARALATLGMPVVRFNFRGVGKSQGVYDRGRGEGDDLRAALDWMAARFPRPLALAGFSFGSMVAMRHLAAHADGRVASYLGVGVPAKNEAVPAEWRWRGPKLLLSGSEDIYASPTELESAARRLPPPCSLRILAGADHFLSGRYQELRALVQEYLFLP